MTRIKGFARGAALAALWLGLAKSAAAGTIVYNTSGLVGSTGVTGTSAVSFVPVSNASFNAPSTLSLGTFVVAALPTGQTTTYNHTPFAITFTPTTMDGLYINATPPSLTLTGFLNGVISGAGLSTVIAQFDQLATNRLQIGPNAYIYLSLPSPQRTLVPSSSGGGASSAEAFVTVTMVQTPEPAAMALFLVVGAGLGWRQLRSRKWSANVAAE